MEEVRRWSECGEAKLGGMRQSLRARVSVPTSIDPILDQNKISVIYDHTAFSSPHKKKHSSILSFL